MKGYAYYQDAVKRMAARGRRTLNVIAVILCTSVGGHAAAADFPSRPVTLVSPFAPGTTNEQVARMIAPKLAEIWKVPVVIENRSGASGTIGAYHVVRSKPDGHTILVGSLSTQMVKLTTTTAKYDPQTDLVPVTKFINYKMLMAVNAEIYAQAKTLDELIDLGNRTPGGVNFGGTGPASMFNVFNAMLMGPMDLKYTAIDYQSSNDITLALLRNDVNYAWNQPNALKPHIESGDVYPLAVASEERYSDWPDVPTVRELGINGYLQVVWGGFFVPKGTPGSLVDKISRDIQAVINEAEMKQRIETQFGGVVPISDSESFARDIEADTTAWREYLKQIGFKP